MRSGRHQQRRVGAFVLQVHAPHGADALQRHPLNMELVHGRLRQRVQCLRELGLANLVEPPLHRGLAHGGLVGQAHAVSRQDAGQRVRKHAGHG